MNRGRVRSDGIGIPCQSKFRFVNKALRSYAWTNLADAAERGQERPCLWLLYRGLVAGGHRREQDRPPSSEFEAAEGSGSEVLVLRLDSASDCCARRPRKMLSLTFFMPSLRSIGPRLVKPLRGSPCAPQEAGALQYDLFLSLQVSKKPALRHHRNELRRSTACIVAQRVSRAERQPPKRHAKQIRISPRGGRAAEFSDCFEPSGAAGAAGLFRRGRSACQTESAFASRMVRGAKKKLCKSVKTGKHRRSFPDPDCERKRCAASAPHQQKHTSASAPSCLRYRDFVRSIHLHLWRHRHDQHDLALLTLTFNRKHGHCATRILVGLNLDHLPSPRSPSEYKISHPLAFRASQTTLKSISSLGDVPYTRYTTP